MNTSLGYAKRTLNDTSVLLSGGGDKPLSDFIGSISWDSTNKKIKYTPVGANSATDLVTFGSNAFNSTSFVTTSTALTISATKTFSSDDFGAALVVHRNHDSYAPVIRFSNNGGTVGYLGFNGSNPTYWPGNATNSKTLIHEGNWSSYIGTSSAPVGYANGAKCLTRLFTKASEASTAVGYYKIATITHTNWSYCSFTMLVSNSYSGTLHNTLFDCRCSDSATSLNNFALNIIGGTNIANKLKYLETRDADDKIIKIEVFLNCSRYEHLEFYLIALHSSAILNLNTTDWGANPDLASSATMTGSAANTIVANSAGTTTNIAGGAQGSIPYLSDAGTTTFLAGGTNGYVLAYDTTNKAPYWKSDSNTQYYLTLNGATKGTANTNNLGTIYAPSSAGTGFLKGTAGANGTITWSWDNSTYNNYELPTASSDTLGGVKTGSAITDTTGYTAIKVKDGVIYYKDTWTAADLNNAGYVPKSTKGKFLHANSSTGALEWTDDNNTWNAASTSQAGYVPKLATGGGTIASTDTAYVLAYKSGVSGTTAPVWIQLPANAYLNDNTWNAASTSLAGYVPKLALASTATIATLSTEYVLTYISGTETAPVWRKLPTNAFNNTWTAWAGASSSSNGTAGYMPAPGTANYLKFLRGDGTWCSLNNYSLPTATDSALGGVKVGTTLTSDTGYTKVHIKDSFIYYKDTNTWQAANTSQVGYVPATSASTMLYANSSGTATWGTPDLYEVNIEGNVDTGETLTGKIAYGGTLGFYFGGGMIGYIDEDGVNISHASSALSATTIGSSAASSGSTIDIPYILTDDYGHVTAGGTHTHTVSISGYLSTGGGTMAGAITIPHDTLAIKINDRTGSGIKYDWSGNEALMISTRAYANASILFYAGMGNNTTKSLTDTTGQWYTTGTSAMGTPSMLMKYSSVLINTPVQTGALTGDYASALYVTGDTYLGGGVKSAGNIWSGTTSDTEERQVGVRSLAGTLYMYAQGSSTGARGLYVTAHGTGSDKGIIGIDTDNNATFYGNVSGSATSASSASTAGSATHSTYLSSNTGGIAANTTSSLTYYNTSTTTTLSTTNGVANPTTAGSGTWYHHITMVRGDSNGYFFDLAFSLADSNNPKIYFRNRAASNYSAWTEIVTSANASDYLSGGGGSITLKNKTFSSLSSYTTYRLVYAYNQSTTADSTLTTLYQTSGLYVNNNGVYHTSDIAYKEAIEKYILKKNILDLENPVKKFKWKGTEDEAVGFIAQETEEWCPEAVGRDEDGYKTVNYTVALSGLCSALYDEIKNLKKEIEELKNKK